ncbi:MAG: NUDIX domain-containing protein [Sphaerochaetaceae bacterium]|nr:NUDIX domain-containing protein [Sphaerochaetaceae bacterium]
MKRGERNSVGEYHKVVHIWIKNSSSKYLVQQRNKSTDRFPYQWAPTAGACITGEDIFSTAVRETAEEIGITLNKSDFKHQGSIYVDNDYSNYIIEVFIVTKDIALDSVKLQYEEVKAVAYYNKNEIYEMMINNQFWQFPNDYFEILEKS